MQMANSGLTFDDPVTFGDAQPAQPSQNPDDELAPLESAIRSDMLKRNDGQP